MRILAALDGTNTPQIVAALHEFPQPSEVLLLYVVDCAPRVELARARQRFLRPHPEVPSHEKQMREAEAQTAQQILDEAQRQLAAATVLRRQGRPELEIVNTAAEMEADLIVIGHRAAYVDAPPLGPHSVGHVARFVLDHAPCAVLLLRPFVPEQFPIAR